MNKLGPSGREGGEEMTYRAGRVTLEDTVFWFHRVQLRLRLCMRREEREEHGCCLVRHGNGKVNAHP
jgi:hypothetical protein